MPEPIRLPVKPSEQRRREIADSVMQQRLLLSGRKPNDPLAINPFKPPSFPPVVEKAVEAARQRNAGIRLLAQDEDITGNFGWAGQDPFYLRYAEGVAFLGYSYLATLAQRAEYRVVTETIAAELTREWIEIKVASGTDEKEDLRKIIEDRLEELNTQAVFRKVAEGDGFFGRAHLYLDTGVTDDPDELITDLGNGRSALSLLKVGPNKNQKLIRLQPVEAIWCYPTFYESIDPLKKNFYDPITWYCMSREIHRSRLLTFVGRPVPDLLKPAYSFGGLSMSQMLKPYVDNWLRTRQAVSDLVLSFSHNILKTNLDATTGVGGDQLMGRIALFNNLKNNQGALVLDKDSEDWANVSVPVGSLDHIQAQSQEHMAAVSRIPLVKLLGIQPAGLNATSEGELIAFEDWIRGFQEALFRAALRTVIDFVQLSEFGQIDHDITFDFRPLRQLKPIEKAQLQSVTAQTREGYFQTGAVDANEMREVLAQDPDSPFEGLDLSKPLPPPPGLPEMPGMPPMPGMGGEQPGGPPQPHHQAPMPEGIHPPRPPAPPRPPSPNKPVDSALGWPDEAPIELDVVPLIVEEINEPPPMLKRPRYG